MRVTVKLFATFRKERFDAEVREVPDGANVSRIVAEVGLPEKEIGIILVNGRHANLWRALADGDTLAIFPLVGGG